MREPWRSGSWPANVAAAQAYSNGISSVNRLVVHGGAAPELAGAQHTIRANVIDPADGKRDDDPRSRSVRPPGRDVKGPLAGCSAIPQKAKGPARGRPLSYRASRTLTYSCGEVPKSSWWPWPNSRPRPLRFQPQRGSRRTALRPQRRHAVDGTGAASARTARATSLHCVSLSSGNMGSERTSFAAFSECGNCPAR